MEFEKNIEEVGSLEISEKFVEILAETIKSYIDNKDNYEVKDWLKNYLTENLPAKNADEVMMIADTITKTVELQSDTNDSMRKAVEEGQDIESWLEKEIVSPDKSLGEQARVLTEAKDALTRDTVDVDEKVTEVSEETNEKWNDSNWNKYKIKAIIKDIAKCSADAAISSAAKEVASKVSEYGFKNIISDKELAADSLKSGVVRGLKAAGACAMQLAAEKDLIPNFDDNGESYSFVSGVAIDNAAVYEDVGSEKISLEKGITRLEQNQTAATAAAVKAANAKKGEQVGATVGALIGRYIKHPVIRVVGQCACSFVGKFIGYNFGEGIKKVASAVKSMVAQKESEALVFLKEKTKVLQ